MSQPLSHIYESLPVAGQAVDCSGTFMQFLNQVFEIFLEYERAFSSRLLKRTCKAAIWARKGGKEFCQGVILISDNSMYRASGRSFTFHPGFTCFRLAMHNKCDLYSIIVQNN